MNLTKKTIKYIIKKINNIDMFFNKINNQKIIKINKK